MKVTNVKKDEVFKMLESGAEVYVMDADCDQAINLKYAPINSVLKELKNERNAFFILESED